VINIYVPSRKEGPKLRPMTFWHKARSYDCRGALITVQPYHAKYAGVFYELPNDQTEAGSAPMCSLCKHQLSCLAGKVQTLTQDDVLDPSQLEGHD